MSLKILFCAIGLLVLGQRVDAQSVAKVMGNKLLIKGFVAEELKVGDWVEIQNGQGTVWGKARIEKIKKNQAIAVLHEGQAANGLRVKKVSDEEALAIKQEKKGPSNFSMYYGKADFKYREPGLMSISGDLSGIGFVYQYRQDIFATLEYEKMTGKNKYDGGTQDGEPVQTTTDDVLSSFRAHLGVPMVQLPRMVVVPYVGIATRSWDDKINGAGGYRREIDYLYAPIGVYSEVQVLPFFSLFADAEYDYFFNGKVKSYLSDADPAYPIVENKQKKGKGERYSGGAMIHYKNIFFRLHYFMQKWKIKTSDPATFKLPIDETSYWEIVVYEPANDTKTSGLLFELGINY